MVILNVTYTVKAGMRDAFIASLKENRISESCLNESGCLKYTFFVPVETSDTDAVFLLEQYTDNAAFAFHKQQPHFLKLQSIKEQYVTSTDVQICHV